MDLGLTALVVLATFSTVHERILEVMRRTFGGPPDYTDLMAIRDGYGRGLLRREGSAARRPEAKAHDQLDPAPPSPGLLRRLLPPYLWKKGRKMLDGLTIGPFSALFAVALAVASRADALALFRRGGGSPDAAFFSLYLSGWKGIALLEPWTWDADARRSVLGCLLMGFSTALGSRFWHDLSKGLIDLRTKARSLPQQVRKLLPAPDAPPDETLTARPPAL